MNVENFLKAISDKTRLRIINLVLSAKEICVCDLENVLKLKQSTLSSHLAKLKNSGVLVDSKRGKWSYYRLNERLNHNYQEILKKVIVEFKKEKIATEDIEIFQKFKNSCLLTRKVLIVDESNDFLSQIIEYELSKKEGIEAFSGGISPAKNVSPILKKMYPEAYKNLRFVTKSITNFYDTYFDLLLILSKDNTQLNNIKAKKKAVINLERDKSADNEYIKKLIKKCEEYL